MVKKIILLFMFMLLTGCTLGSNLGNALSISADELDAYMQENQDATYIDVRSEEEYDQGHVNGFKNVQSDEVLKYLEKNNEKSDKIVVISRSGTESKQVAEELESNNYHDVVNVTNGYQNYPHN